MKKGLAIILAVCIVVSFMGCYTGTLVYGTINEATFEGNITDVKSHLLRGVEVNAKDEAGWTPLHWAVYKAVSYTHLRAHET